MKISSLKQRMIIYVSAFALLCLLAFNNCSKMDSRSDEKNLLLDSNKSFGTDTGNALSSELIVAKACDIIRAAHSELSFEDCRLGLLSTSLSSKLGVPDSYLNPFHTLVEVEVKGGVKANSEALEKCLSQISELNTQSEVVKSSYVASSMDSFKNSQSLFSSASGSCPDVYKDNVFIPPAPPVVLPGTVVMNFDSPAPPSNYSIPGIYGDIDFSMNPNWFWTEPYGANTSKSLYLNGNYPASFSFVGGGRKLISMSLSTKKSGLVTFTDDQGQTASLYVEADLKTHLLKFDFPQLSNVVTVNFPHIWSLTIDDITYAEPETKPTISFVQGSTSVYQANLATTKMKSSATAGNAILVVMDWDPGYSLSSLTDNLGNSYQPLSQPQVYPQFSEYYPGPFSQLWMATNIKGGNIEVTARFSGKKYFNQYVGYNFHIFEYKGIDPINPLEKYSVTKANSQYILSDEISTQLTDFMVFNYIELTMTDFVPSPGFTNRVPTDYGITNVAQDKSSLTPGKFTTSGYIPGGVSPWMSQIMVFRAAK